MILCIQALCLLPALSLSRPIPGQDPTDRERFDELLERIDELTNALDKVREEINLLSDGTTPPAKRFEWWAEHLAMEERSAFADSKWQHLGPTNISGRVTDVALTTPRGETYVMYAATASGGVWKTGNEGQTWESVFDDGPTQSIGDITLAPSDQSQLWVGTGEANIFRSSMAGCGVYRSLDGGETFEHKGLAATHTIARIVIHPTDPETVYVAASGHEWTDNPERGVYRTVDGGESWDQVLFVDEQSGAIDLVMDPVKPEILYAATWERRRKRWNDPRAEPDHTGSGIWRTTDAGDSWEPVNDGLPEPQHRGRIGIDVARSNPNVLYAFIDNYEEREEDDEEEEEETDSYGREREAAIKASEIYRSDDRALTWRKVSKSDDYMARIPSTYGWVFGQMRVDPTNEDKIYVMGLSLHVSEDGGDSFRRLGGMHADHHALWIDPINTDYLVNGNDGGISVSYDGGEHWHSHTDNLPAVQFYNVGYDMEEPFNVYGSIQDHGSRKSVANVARIRGGRENQRAGRRRSRGRGVATEWESTSGGEASYHAVDPSDPDTLYSAGFYGSIGRSDQASGERARLRLETEDEEDELRGQWLAPFIISPHNPRIIYHGMNRLFRSMDRGEKFAPISPNLTGNDPDQLGDIPFQTIATISESPFEFGRIFVGSDDGLLHVTFDSGKTWKLISDDLPRERWFSRVVASQWTDGVVYAAQNGKRWDDFTAYLWRSENDGESWRSIADGIPGGPINVVAEDPKNPDVLYVGTDLGVYVSMDRGESWDALTAGLPTTYVHDLIVHPRDDVIVIATHGRGMWAMDARPIQDPEFGRSEEEEGEEEAQDAESAGKEAATEGETAEGDGEVDEAEAQDAEDEAAAADESAEGEAATGNGEVDEAEAQDAVDEAAAADEGAEGEAAEGDEGAARGEPAEGEGDDDGAGEEESEDG
jgi:photosystem II stability/assembly factor-like uncharacterized protein